MSSTVQAGTEIRRASLKESHSTTSLKHDCSRRP
jgi:hypothetical protein